MHKKAPLHSSISLNDDPLTALLSHAPISSYHPISKHYQDLRSSMPQGKPHPTSTSQILGSFNLPLKPNALQWRVEICITPTQDPTHIELTVTEDNSKRTNISHPMEGLNQYSDEKLVAVNDYLREWVMNIWDLPLESSEQLISLIKEEIGLQLQILCEPLTDPDSSTQPAIPQQPTSTHAPLSVLPSWLIPSQPEGTHAKTAASKRKRKKPPTDRPQIMPQPQRLRTSSKQRHPPSIPSTSDTDVSTTDFLSQYSWEIFEKKSESDLPGKVAFKIIRLKHMTSGNPVISLQFIVPTQRECPTVIITINHAEPSARIRSFTLKIAQKMHKNTVIDICQPIIQEQWSLYSKAQATEKFKTEIVENFISDLIPKLSAHISSLSKKSIYPPEIAPVTVSSATPFTDAHPTTDSLHTPHASAPVAQSIPASTDDWPDPIPYDPTGVTPPITPLSISDWPDLILPDATTFTPPSAPAPHMTRDELRPIPAEGGAIPPYGDIVSMFLAFLNVDLDPDMRAPIVDTDEHPNPVGTYPPSDGKPDTEAPDVLPGVSAFECSW